MFPSLFAGVALLKKIAVSNFRNRNSRLELLIYDISIVIHGFTQNYGMKKQVRK